MLIKKSKWNREASLLLSVAVCLSGAAAAIGAEKSSSAWQLSLGKEYPGARGRLDPGQTGPSGGDSLVLLGDFLLGGRFVAAEEKVALPAETDKISFWVKATNTDSVDIRLVDSGGNTHQEKLPLKQNTGWQEITLSRFAAHAGTRGPKWHGSVDRVALVLDKSGLANPSVKRGSLSFFLVNALTPKAESRLAANVYRAPVLPAIAEGPALPAVSFETPRHLMYFWGKNDVPTRAVVVISGSEGTEGSFPMTPVRLLDHRGEIVRELWKGTATVTAKNSFRQELDITPPGFGLFYVAMDYAGESMRVPFAWMADQAKTWPQSPFGVQMHFAEGPWGRHQKIGAAGAVLDLVQKMGAGWFRDELFWSESTKGRIDISMNALNPYFFVAPAAQTGMQSLVVLNGGSPLYDNNQAPHSREALDEFKRFAATAAEKWSQPKWGPGVKCWEVWDEPNSAQGWLKRAPSAKEYTALLKAAYQGVKSADPNATVIGGACSGFDLSFINSVLQEGGAKYMDAISVHQIQDTAPELPLSKEPQSKDTAYLARLESLKAVLNNNGAGKLKVWLTGSGFANKQHSYSDADVAAYNVRMFLLALSQPYVERIFKYNFQDRGDAASNRWDYVLGAVQKDGAPKVDFVAYNTMSRLLYKKHFVRALPVADGAYLYEFAGNGEPVFAAWTSQGKASLSLGIKSGRVGLVDLMGNEKVAHTENDHLALQVGEEPVFVTRADSIVPEKTMPVQASR